MEIQRLLPDSAFIPFLAYRLNNATVAYLNLPLLQKYGYFSEFTSITTSLLKAVLDEFAYIVPDRPGEDSTEITTESREFLAERYGGVGILSNGGGARCGLTGPFQVKGIGLTPVGGSGVNFWYSHGGLSLREAIIDGLMGEAAEQALPFPNSRVVAIIDTGTMTWQRAYTHKDPELDERVQLRRGLLVRESGIRPAHFSRAFYFKPKPEVKAAFPHDFQRVEECIPQLPVLMKIEADPDWPVSVAYRVAIENMMTRSAIQLAVSKSKRLMHGSLTQSNFLINGGWIDLGTATALQHYGDTFTTANQPSNWQEFTLFQKTCEDLCFYTSKFVPDPQEFLNGTLVYNKFIASYHQQLITSMLALVGLPSYISKTLAASDAAIQLGSLLIEIAEAEWPQSSLAASFYRDYTWPEHSLRAVLHELCIAYWNKPEITQPKLPFKIERNNYLWKIYCAYCQAAEDAANKRSIPREGLAYFVMFNMTRQAIPMHSLYRDALLNHYTALIESSSPQEPLFSTIDKDFIQQKLLNDLLLKEYDGTDTPLYIGSYATLWWSAATNRFVFELTNNNDEKKFISISKPVLVTPFMKRIQFENRADNSITASFHFSHLDDFDDLHACILTDEDNQEYTFTMNDLFPEFDRLYKNYRATAAGKTIPADGI